MPFVSIFPDFLGLDHIIFSKWKIEKITFFSFFFSNLCKFYFIPVEIRHKLLGSMDVTQCFANPSVHTCDINLDSESGLAGSAGKVTSTVRVSTPITATGMPPKFKYLVLFISN